MSNSYYALCTEPKTPDSGTPIPGTDWFRWAPPPNFNPPPQPRGRWVWVPEIPGDFYYVPPYQVTCHVH